MVHRLPKLPDVEHVDDEMTVLPLSLTEDGNPLKEWLLEHGRTCRCRACERGLFHGVKHSVTCRRRYRAWLEEMKEGSPEPPARQGGEVADDGLPEPIGIDDDDPVVDVELPMIMMRLRLVTLGCLLLKITCRKVNRGDSETEEPENNDPHGAGGSGDVPMDVDAYEGSPGSVFGPVARSWGALNCPNIARSFASKLQPKRTADF